MWLIYVTYTKCHMGLAYLCQGLLTYEHLSSDVRTSELNGGRHSQLLLPFKSLSGGGMVYCAILRLYVFFWPYSGKAFT